jgi:hypothetical protein|tara:strand:- start:154 stop:534 length:381 start_codon:yes stop_codon:yes gene_type:complete
MATYGEILELIATNKADNSGITAAEDRQVDIAILDFIKDNIPILKGVQQIGDVSPTDQSITITFPDIGTSSYYVIGTLKGNSSNFDTDNDVFWLFGATTTNSFKIYLREVSGNVQNLFFYWELKLI